MLSAVRKTSILVDSFYSLIIQILCINYFVCIIVICQIFERILYIWALKHPASGYVQGINDLVTPFFVVFLSQHIGEFSLKSYKMIVLIPYSRLWLLVVMWEGFSHILNKKYLKETTSKVCRWIPFFWGEGRGGEGGGGVPYRFYFLLAYTLAVA